MIVKERSFPYPVLAPFSDDVSPNAFTLSVTVRSDADNFYLATNFAYANASIEALIAEGQASHALHIECRRNFFRSLYRFPGRSEQVVLGASDILGRVEVSGFVVAEQPMQAYRIAGAHADYGDSTFPIDSGDVLAVAPTVVFDAHMDYDPLVHISSILTVRESDDDIDGPMTLDTTDDRIVVTLARSDYRRYVDLKGDPRLGSLLANQLVVPALIEAVHEIKATIEQDDDVEMNKRWYRSIVHKLDQLRIDVRKDDTSAIETAQFLLSFPVRRSLQGLIEITAEDGES